jgi:hypothetical protein
MYGTRVFAVFVHAPLALQSILPCCLPQNLGWKHLVRIVPVVHLDSVFCHDLDIHALEVNGHSPFQLICAQFEDCETLLEVDRGVMVLV